MIKPISKASEYFYKYVAKPVAFRLHPDKVHDNLVKTAKTLQRFALYRLLLSWAWAYKNPKVLGQKIHGVYFANPVGLSAGFDTNFELAPTLKSIGFGSMEGGSLTFHPCKGNPRPWFHRLPKTKSIVVNKGLANDGVDSILAHIATYPQDTFNDFVLNISVAKTNTKDACTDEGAIADYIGSLKAIKKSDLGDIVTLNISCPNAYGGEPFTTPERLRKLLEAVDHVGLHQPIFIKMPSDKTWADFRKLLDIIVLHKISGVTIHNLMKTRDGIHAHDKISADIKGNLSGKPTQKTSNELIARTYKAYGKRLTITGVGGIFSAADAYEKIRLGATNLELITGLLFEGPQVVGQINLGLAEMLQKDGFTNISQATGSAHTL